MPLFTPRRAPRAASFLIPAVLLLAVSTSAVQASDATPVDVLPGRADSPTIVAAGNGHAVVMRQLQPSGSELLEVGIDQPPRLVRTFTGDVSAPSVGTDAAGRVVVVVRPCAKRRATKQPTCTLAMVSLATGRTVRLPGTGGAYLGDVDRGRVVVARHSARSGARVALGAAKPGGRSTPLTLHGVAPAAPGGAIATTRWVSSLDLRGGVLAGVLSYSRSVGGGSMLLRGTARGWSVLARSSYGEGGLGPRVFLGSQVTPTGVRGYFDGAGDAASFVGRWSARGQLLGRVPAARFGDPASLDGAAFDGDTLLLGPDHYACGEGADPCPVRAVRPVAPE